MGHILPHLQTHFSYFKGEDRSEFWDKILSINNITTERELYVIENLLLTSSTQDLL